MRGRIFCIGLLLGAMCCFAANAVAESSGSVDPNNSSIWCDQGGQGFGVVWMGTWQLDGDNVYVVGYCEPDYGFGSVPPLTNPVGGRFEYPNSPGVAYTYVPPTYYYEGTNYPLRGCYVWFGFGEWIGDVFVCRICTGSCYLTRPPGSCFAAGTPVLTPQGSKPIEQFRAGDLVLSSPDNRPNGRPVPCRVEEVIRSRGRLVDIAVGGHVIHASREHPLYVKGKAWTRAGSLAVGDLLRGHDGRWVPVESLVDGPERPVYNLRIDKHSTYFVGRRDWGFSLWVYAACNKPQASKEYLAESNSVR